MIATVKFLDYSLAVKPLPPFLLDKSSKITINTINWYSYCIAERDEVFRQALLASDILLPDGTRIVKACSYLTGKSIKKISGAELHQDLLIRLNQEKGTCFYLGSSQITLTRINLRLSKEYPAISARFYSPPYKKEFSENDLLKMVEKINDFKPNVVFIGLTAPKQEKLSFLIKDKLETNVICSIGAVFDLYAETVKRPSQFWVNSNIQWLIKQANQPKRMWKRYLYFRFLFACSIQKRKLNPKGYTYKNINASSSLSKIGVERYTGKCSILL